MNLADYTLYGAQDKQVKAKKGVKFIYFFEREGVKPSPTPPNIKHGGR